MKTIKLIITSITWILILFVLTGSALSGDKTWDAVEKLVREEVRYSGLSDRANQKDIETLTRLKIRAESPELTAEDRASVYRELFSLVYRLMGKEVSKQSLERNVSLAVSWSNPKTSVSFNTPSVALPATLGSVKPAGNGKIAMILIPDIGADWKVYESFMKRNESAYRMFAVTLPGFAGTPAPERPLFHDYSKLTWWKNAEESLLKLIHKENLKDVVLVGHQAGGYLAMRMALDHPQLIHSAVLLNSLIYGPSPTDPAKKLTLQERKEMVNGWLPVGFFPRPSPEQYKQFLSSMADGIAWNKADQQMLLDTMANMIPSTWWNYYCELMTTDLTEELALSKVPMLVLVSLYEEGNSSAVYGKLTLDQWEAFQKRGSDVPMRIVTFDKTRSYLQLDKSKEFDAAIREFVIK